MVARYEQGVSNELAAIADPLRSYEELRVEYSVNPERHPLFTSLLPIKGLEKGESAYNCDAHINDYGDLILEARCEPEDPNCERSNIKTAVWRNNQFVIINTALFDAQDSHRIHYNKYRNALGAVGIDCGDSSKPGTVTFVQEEVYSCTNGTVNKRNVAYGIPMEKDSRLVYAGVINNRRMAIEETRERKELYKGGPIKSVLQGMAVSAPKTPQEIVDINRRVRTTPGSEIVNLVPDPNMWQGPNHLTPLARNNGVIPVGALEHIGIRTAKLTSSGKPILEYSGLAAQYSYSIRTGKVVEIKGPKIIAMSSDFPDSEPKREEHISVFFPTSLIYGMDGGEFPKYTLLFGGLRDRKPAVALISYPYDLPPDRKLNKEHIWSVKNCERFISSLENSSRIRAASAN